LIEANKLGIPIIHRSELLALLVHGKRAVAVAGTHGKTTTTAMLALILQNAELDPTVFLGGISLDFGDNYRLGSDDLIVFEADESDASFHRYQHCWQIVTNIDRDHLDRHGNLANIRRLFAEFMSIGDPEGFLIYGSDTEELPELAQHFPGATRSFGLDDEHAFYHASNVGYTADFRSTAELQIDGRFAGTLSLALPGRHNLSNAVAAIGMAHSMGVEPDAAIEALTDFSGIERRFQLLYHREPLRVFEDYAHHPTEIRAALQGARDLFPHARLMAVFQPHLPSRTKLLLDDFANSFAEADEIIINSIYAAREAPIPGFTAETVAERIRHVQPDKPVHYFDDQDELLEYVWARIGMQEVVMVMGAGDINRVGHALADRLSQEHG
jgi:UDP-N-acetylmuramate--alanine ligase